MNIDLLMDNHICGVCNQNRGTQYYCPRCGTYLTIGVHVSYIIIKISQANEKQVSDRIKIINDTVIGGLRVTYNYGAFSATSLPDSIVEDSCDINDLIAKAKDYHNRYLKLKSFW